MPGGFVCETRFLSAFDACDDVVPMSTVVQLSHSAGVCAPDEIAHFLQVPMDDEPIVLVPQRSIVVFQQYALYRLVLENDATVQFGTTDLIGAHFGIHLFHMLIEARVAYRTFFVFAPRARRMLEIFGGLVIVADVALFCSSPGMS